MVECFCGCGREVKRLPLGIRSINKRGQQVAERLAWSYAVLEHVPSDPSDSAGAQARKDWHDGGREILARIASSVHGDTDPRTLDESAVRDWQAVGREAEVTLVAAGFPPLVAWLKDYAPDVQALIADAPNPT